MSEQSCEKSCGNYNNGYSTLACYNAGDKKLIPGQTGGMFIVPQYGSIGYNALTHGVKNGSGGYFKIDDAYHTNKGKCETTYARKFCGGCNGCK